MSKRIYPDAEAARLARNKRAREKRNATDKTRQAYNAYQAAWRRAHPERWKEIWHNAYVKSKGKNQAGT